MHGLKNACYNSFVTATHNLRFAPPFEVIVYSFEKLHTNELLLLFLVDTYVWFSRVTRSHTTSHAVTRNNLPNDFMEQVMAKTEELQRGIFTRLPHSCTYHVHWDETDQSQCPSHISYSRSGFRLVGEGVGKILADMSNNVLAGTHQFAEALSRVVVLAAI